MIPIFMLFEPPGEVSFLYLIGWLFIYYVGTSLITLSHASWASVIASKYHERSRVFGAIQVVSIIGATAVLILPVVLPTPAAPTGAAHTPPLGQFLLPSP